MSMEKGTKSTNTPKGPIWENIHAHRKQKCYTFTEMEWYTFLPYNTGKG